MTLPSPLEIGAIGSALIVGAGLVVFFLKAFEMAMLLGAAGGALIVVAGLLSQYVQMGDDRRAAEDRPIIEQKDAELAACTTDRKTALDANKTLAASIEPIKAGEAAQNKAIEALASLWNDNVGRIGAMQRANETKIAALESDTNMVFRNAAGALMNLTCDQREKKYGDFVHSIAVREYADRPPKDAPNKPGVSVK